MLVYMNEERPPSWRHTSAERIQSWFARYEKPISSISLIGGFIVDWITLQRIDTFFENFLVSMRLMVVAFCIILLNRSVLKSLRGNEQEKVHFWLINILQFAFGGLMSTFLVFYFRSGSIFVSWPFLLLLGIAFAANERLKHHYSRMTFQISFLFLSIYSFAIFSLPIIVQTVSPLVFIASGVLSLGVIFLYLKALRFFVRQVYEDNKRALILSIGTVFLVVNMFYFLNIIPPIPLSLKDAGVYHEVTKNENGNYVLSGEKKKFINYFELFEDVHIRDGGSLSVYSAIFSPTKLNTAIVHKWQWYNEETRKWITMGTIPLSIIGGRGDGFRTYSSRDTLREGDWRVSVENDRGQVLGRVHFTVFYTNSDVPLVTTTTL